MVKFSVAHSEKNQEDYPHVFYELLKNTSPDTIKDIEDLYFGKFFRYNYDGVDKQYGNCMGIESTDEAIDYLFKIQDEFGITISLTMNELNIPIELQLNGQAIDLFLDWIGEFYNRGLRSITLAHTHLVRSGKLKKRFPLLRIKNTVNHLVSDAQQVVDYAYLGYNTILLDRSLNRNFTELKKIKKAVDGLNAKKKDKSMPLRTSLLVSEACIYKCPFKQEHDTLGATISTDYFKTLSVNTCDGWRDPSFRNLPRNGVDLYTTYTDTFNEIAQYVDIFKFSGRFTPARFSKERIIEENMKFVWVFNGASEAAKNKFTTEIIGKETLLIAKEYKDILEHNAAPIHHWSFSYVFGNVTDYYITKEKYQRIYNTYISDDIWFTKEGRELEKTLQNCKSQCWDCHKCEEVYGLPNIDSALQLKTKGFHS